MKNKAKDETKYKITDETCLKNFIKVGEEGLYFKKRKKINAVFSYSHTICFVLGLGCCMQAFSRCRDLGLLFAAVQGFLVPVVSLSSWGAQALGCVGFGSCGRRAQ